MSKLSNIVFAAATVLSTGAHAADAPEQLPEEPNKYSNFITTLKSLCKTHDHILLGDIVVRINNRTI